MAVFRCRYSEASIIKWRVNGTVIETSESNADIMPDVVQDNEGNVVDILSISGYIQYNTTLIECIAQFENGVPDESTEPVALLLQGENHVCTLSHTYCTTLHTCMSLTDK